MLAALAAIPALLLWRAKKARNYDQVRCFGTLTERNLVQAGTATCKVVLKRLLHPVHASIMQAVKPHVPTTTKTEKGLDRDAGLAQLHIHLPSVVALWHVQGAALPATSNKHSSTSEARGPSVQVNVVPVNRTVTNPESNLVGATGVPSAQASVHATPRASARGPIKMA